jgi:hypothetical protein
MVAAHGEEGTTLVRLLQRGGSFGEELDWGLDVSQVREVHFPAVGREDGAACGCRAGTDNDYLLGNGLALDRVCEHRSGG